MSYIRPSKVLAHLDRLSGWQRGDTPAPVTVEWDLSNRCVLGCQDCHFAHTHVKGPWASKPRLLPMAFDGTGDLADIRVVTRGLADMAAAGVRGVIWSGGGEPTTHPDWLLALRAAREAGLEQGMYTLGGLLTPTTAALASELLSWVVVSLDCVNAGNYAREKQVPESRFTAACNGIVSLSGGQAVVGVSFLLHRNNWHDADGMVALAKSLGADYVTFRPAVQFNADAPSWPNEPRHWVTAALPTIARVAADPFVECDVERFLQYRDWNGHGYDLCHAIKVNATVTPDGRVWVCPQRRGVTGSAIGNLTQESFAEIWARHPRTFAVDDQCRVMCRLHLLNEQLQPVFATYQHEAFV